jgi:hypothetical protein
MVSNRITALGYYAGHNATGDYNTLVGWNAGAAIVGGTNNTCVGHMAGLNMVTNTITAVGCYAGRFATGDANTVVGYRAGEDIAAGFGSTIMGYDAGSALQTGSLTAIGYSAGYNVTGDFNTLVGYRVGERIVAGAGSTAVGYFAGNTLVTGSITAMGYRAGMLATGADNTMVGYSAGVMLMGGTGNVFVGHAAASAVTTNVNNTVVGYNAAPADGLTNVTALGYNAAPTANDTCVLGAGQRVVENTAGRLETWNLTTLSSTSTGTNSPLLFPTASIWIGGVLNFNPAGTTNTGLSLRTGNAEAFINGVVRSAYTPAVGHVRKLLIWNGGTASVYVLAGSITTTSTSSPSNQGVFIKGRNTIPAAMSAMCYCRITAVTATYTSTSTATWPNSVDFYMVSGTD